MNTINERLDRLEKLTNSTPIEPAFIADIHNKEEDIKKQRKIKTYNEIKDSYIDDIKKFFNNPIKELSNVIEHTVYFVEKYAPIISSLFSVVVKGEAKLSFALELIGLVVDLTSYVLDTDFVKNMINHFVDIMNERRITSTTIEKTKKKQGCFNKKKKPTISLR